MNIAYASDNNFVDVMCVSIMSFNDHNYDAKIYILDCGINEKNKQKILELCSDKNTVLFVDAKKELDKLDFDLNMDRGSIASYARLFVGSILPIEIDKVLYMDSDTLIRDSLEEMYKMSLEPYVIGGVRDAFSVCNKRVFGINKGELMINAGVMLIDLKIWREQKYEEMISELLKKQERVFQGDQGVINTIAHGCVKELPLRYDVMTYLYDFTYKEMMIYRHPDLYFNEKTIIDAVENPAIVHFTTSFRSYRPWELGDNKHPFFEEWLNYFKKVDAPFKRTDRKIVTIKGVFFMTLVGVLHAYIRPLLYLVGVHNKTR